MGTPKKPTKKKPASKINGGKKTNGLADYSKPLVPPVDGGDDFEEPLDDLEGYESFNDYDEDDEDDY